MISSRFPVIAIALVTGFLLATQISAYRRISLITQGDNVKILAVETSELIKNIDNLEKEKQILDEQHQKLTTSNAQSQESIARDIDRLKIISGEIEVAGEGIEIKFEKSLDVSEMIDLTNALRNIGAEAIYFNERRIIASSGFLSQLGQSPLKVSVIGKKELIGQAVSRRGGILEQIGHGSISEQSTIIIPMVK